jgi:hypothetical protein
MFDKHCEPNSDGKEHSLLSAIKKCRNIEEYYKIM